MDKGTLDFHANQPFKVRQVKDALYYRGNSRCIMLADKLRNLCFMQGLYSDRIQTTVRSRNSDGFDDSQKSFGGRKCYYLQTGKVQDGKVIFF